MNRLLFAIDSARTEDENGFLHVASSHITKATINPYRGDEIPGWDELGLDPDRIYMALRDPDELRKSLDTWAGLPLQFEHHAEGAQEDEARKTRVGTVGTDVQWHSPYIDAPLTIWDKRAIDAVKDGTCRELSCAYWYEPDFTPGTYQGEPYDFVMRKIRGNHVALVPEGRAGHDVLVADSKPDFSTTNRPQVAANNREGIEMPIRRMARDGDPAVEKKEQALGEVIEAAGQKLQDLHTTDPQGNVIDKPAAAVGDDELPTQDGADLDAIKAKYNLSDEALAEIQAALAPAQDEDVTADPAQDADEDETDKPAAADADENEQACDEDELSEDEDKAVCDAMESVGLDPKNEDLKAAFVKGMKAGDPDEEKRAPAIDEDEVVQKAEDRALRRVKADFAARYKAAEKVAPLVGKINPLTFDSAAGIYAYALRSKGINLTGRKVSQYETLLDGYMAARYPRVKRAQAHDGKPTDNKLNGLRNIRIED